MSTLTEGPQVSPEVELNLADEPSETSLLFASSPSRKLNTDLIVRAIEHVKAILREREIDPLLQKLDDALVQCFTTPHQGRGEIESRRQQFELAMLACFVNQKANAFLTQHGRGIVLAAPATKGGVGKTFIISNLAVLLAWAALIPVLCAEINENDGTMRFKIGADREGRPLLPEVARNPSLIDTFAKLAAKLPKHPQTPVYTLLSDPQNSEYANLNLGHILAAIETGAQNVGATLCDMGNGLNANEGAVLSADTLLPVMYARDDTSASTLISTLINLHRLGHGERIKRHARFVLTGVSEGESIADYQDRIIAAATEECRTPQHEPAWLNSPRQMLKDFGMLATTTEDENPWYRLDSERWNCIRYSDYGSLPLPASVLPEDTGIDTIIDLLRLLNDIFDTKMPPDTLKIAERQRRLDETRAAEGLRRESIDVPLSETALRRLTPEERRQLLRQVAAIEAARDA